MDREEVGLRLMEERWFWREVLRILSASGEEGRDLEEKRKGRSGRRRSEGNETSALGLPLVVPRRENREGDEATTNTHMRALIMLNLVGEVKKEVYELKVVELWLVEN